MNNTNRGIIAGIDMMLESIEKILESMAENEFNKEIAFNGGSPIEAKHGAYSPNLSEASSCIKEARKLISCAMPEKIDFAEEYREERRG